MCPQNVRIEQPLWYRCDRQFMNVMKIISIAFKIAIDLSAEKKVFRMWSPTHKYIHSRIFPFISIRSAVQLSDGIRFNFKRFPFDLVGLFYLWTKNNWKWSNYNTWTWTFAIQNHRCLVDFIFIVVLHVFHFILNITVIVVCTFEPYSRWKSWREIHSKTI